MQSQSQIEKLRIQVCIQATALYGWSTQIETIYNFIRYKEKVLKTDTKHRQFL